MASAAGIRLGKVFVEIGADPTQLFGALNKLNKRIGAIGQSMTNFGGRMTAVGGALAAPLALASRQFASFDDAIRATAAVTGSLGPQGAAALAMLNEKARELGATTSFTAVQVANLMTELGRAGFNPQEINAMTESVLALARATGTDASLAAGIMAATLRQFSLGASDAARVADILTAAANSTFNTVEGLGESLKFAGPVAKSLGMSLEDTVAVLGVLGNVGIQGSEAGTALRRLSVIAAGSGKQLQQLFGISNTDAGGNLKPLVNILDEINTVTANMPVAERTEKMAKAFGLLGITSANVLSQSAGGVADLAAKLQNAEGTAATTAKEMDAGLGGAMRIAMSAIEGTALAIGDALAPSLQKAIEFVSQLAGSITTFVRDNEALIVSVVKGIASFAAAGVALAALGFTLSTLSGAMGLVIGASTAVVGAFAAVVTGAGGVLFSLAALIVKYGATAAASIAAAAVTQAVWVAANWPILAAIGSTALLVKGLVTSKESASLLGSAVGGVSDGMRRMAEEFVKVKDVGVSAFQEINASIAEGDIAGAVQVAMQALMAAFTIGGNAFLNEVDRWGVNLVNAFDFYISQIPFLRFAGGDKFSFSVFGDSTQGTNANTRADSRFQTLDARQARRREASGNALDAFNAAVGQRQSDRLLTQSAAIAATATSTPAQPQPFALPPDVMAAIAQAQAQDAAMRTARQEAVTKQQEAGRVQQDAMAAAASQSEAIGTFSSVGLGGMGFGGNLQQQQLEEAKKTNRILEDKLGNEGIVEE